MKKYNNNFKERCNNCYGGLGKVENKLMQVYYNLYSTGCGIDMFVKGCNIKKMLCIIQKFRK